MLKGMFQFLNNVNKFFRKEKKMKNAKYDLARTILGDDFISPEEIQEGSYYTRLKYGDEMLQYFTDTLPCEDALEWLRDNNYVLIAGPPSSMSILDVRGLHNRLFYSYYRAWYDECEWASSEWQKEAKPEWLMVRKGAVPDSVDKPLKEQVKLLLKGEHVPSVVEVAWCESRYKEIRGKWLFGLIEVRTSTLTLVRDHNSPGIEPHWIYGAVIIGWSNRCGIGVTKCLNYEKSWDLGLASARKPCSFK